MVPLHTPLKQPFAALIYNSFAAILLAFFILLLGMLLVGSSDTCIGDACKIITSGYVIPFISVVIIIILAYPILYWLLFSYELTEHTITINTGILFRQYETIDFDRIQTVDNERGPLLWLLGLTEVNIWTASPDQVEFSLGQNSVSSHAHPDTTLILDETVAQQLKDYIMHSRHTSTPPSAN